jgi:hypothetical protein
MSATAAVWNGWRARRPGRRPPSLGTPALVVGLTVIAAAAGAAAAVAPIYALAPFGALALIVLAFRAPVTHLMLLLAATAIVGYSLQHQLGSHLLPSDALLLTGLLRASVVMLRQRLGPLRLAAVGLMSLFAIATIVQALHGLQAGHNSSQVGDEARDLLGFGAFLIAVPILSEADGARRLGRGLVVVGLTLGLWGLLTWLLGISLGENVDIGLRSSVNFATSGSGQLHGGLYAYPVAVIMSAAVLLSDGVPVGWRWPAAAVLCVNLVALALTYERTFWLTTAVTVGFVVVKMGRGRRLRAAVRVMVTALILLGLLATVSPRSFSKMEARVLTLGQAQSDSSVRYRVVETDLVLHNKVQAKPVAGWGLGDTLYWGQPWSQVPPRAQWFTHNGYLWLIWKVGVVQALVLFALLIWAIALPARPEGDPGRRALRVAAQGGLLVLLLSSVAFPSFNSITITAVMGVLLAICFMPRSNARPSAARAPSAAV